MKVGKYSLWFALGGALVNNHRSLDREDSVHILNRSFLVTTKYWRVIYMSFKNNACTFTPRSGGTAAVKFRRNLELRTSALNLKETYFKNEINTKLRWLQSTFFLV